VIKMATIQVLDRTDLVSEPTFASLRSLLVDTHEHIRLARRSAVALPGSASIGMHLQTLEAELIRAKVALNEMERSSGTIIPFDSVALNDRF
jgi:hypothetical protein